MGGGDPVIAKGTTCGKLEDSQAAIYGGRNELVAIGREAQGPDRSIMSFQIESSGPGGEFVDVNLSVVATAGQEVSVRREGQVVDGCGVPRESAQICS
jgi:hypothetical protein